uniref:Complex 1 LYR protein domain-containing protein n=1 Tax=Prolemur simus TaxID=1328070 RepID=A0A8C8Z0R2_PROSS
KIASRHMVKQFMRSQQVLLLYRRILQAIWQVPKDFYHKYLKDWAREEFKTSKSVFILTILTLSRLRRRRKRRG